jgi:hypothetical protein
MSAPRRFATYDDALRVAYEEEIAGEAYFRALASRHEGRAAEALTLLAEVEAATAAALAPLIARRRLVTATPVALAAEGVADAAARARMPWPALAAWMAESFPAYIAEFEAIEAMGPTEDAEALRLATEHERAAVAFATLETAGDPESFGPLRAFLAQAAAP